MGVSATSAAFSSLMYYKHAISAYSTLISIWLANVVILFIWLVSEQPAGAGWVDLIDAQSHGVYRPIVVSFITAQFASFGSTISNMQVYIRFLDILRNIAHIRRGYSYRSKFLKAKMYTISGSDAPDVSLDNFNVMALMSLLTYVVALGVTIIKTTQTSVIVSSAISIILLIYTRADQLAMEAILLKVCVLCATRCPGPAGPPQPGPGPVVMPS